MRGRGKSMVLLDQQIQDSIHQMLVRNLTVHQFYQFYNILKEVLPVMNLLQQQSGVEVDQAHLEKLDLLHQRNTIQNLQKKESTNISEGYDVPHQLPRGFDEEIGVERASGGLFEKKPVEKEEEKKQLDNNHLYEGEERDCSICLFEKMQVVLPCMHAFCKNCIAHWLKREQECPVCRSSIHEGLSMLSSRSNSLGKYSFFELIDIEGDDNVVPELEKKVEYLVNTSIDYLLAMPDYDLDTNMRESNPHIKIDIDKY